MPLPRNRVLARPGRSRPRRFLSDRRPVARQHTPPGIHRAHSPDPRHLVRPRNLPLPGRRCSHGPPALARPRPGLRRRLNIRAALAVRLRANPRLVRSYHLVLIWWTGSSNCRLLPGRVRALRDRVPVLRHPAGRFTRVAVRAQECPLRGDRKVRDSLPMVPGQGEVRVDPAVAGRCTRHRRTCFSRRRSRSR